MSSSSSVRSTSASSATGSSSSTVSPSRSDHPRSRRAHAPDPPRLAGLFASESSAIPQLRRTPMGLGRASILSRICLTAPSEPTGEPGNVPRSVCESARMLLYAEQLFIDDLGVLQIAAARVFARTVPRFPRLRSDAGSNLLDKIFNFGSVQSYKPTDVVTFELFVGDETSNCIRMNAQSFCSGSGRNQLAGLWVGLV